MAPVHTRWTRYLQVNPRGTNLENLSFHDIPDERSLCTDEMFHPECDPLWPKNDGVILLGTPLGSPEFGELYLQAKLSKHKVLLSFIREVAKTRFLREAHHMFTWSAAPPLTHMLKSLPEDDASIGWMEEVDEWILTFRYGSNVCKRRDYALLCRWQNIVNLQHHKTSLHRLGVWGCILSFEQLTNSNLFRGPLRFMILGNGICS